MRFSTFLPIAIPVILLSGCGPKRSQMSPTLVSSPYATTPQLPSPRAGTYARVISTPSDPAIAATIGERRWDASLSGAASGLALRSVDNEGGYSMREIREAAWNAGYPYPISHLAVWQTEAKNPPPTDLATWLSEIPEKMDIGLVRARSGTRETWVALAANPLIDLGIIPREVSVQTPLKFPKIEDATLEISNPLGVWTKAPLTKSKTVNLDTEGEWVVAITDKDGDLARFTLYAGTKVPEEAIILGPALPVKDDAAAIEVAKDILIDARRTYGLGPLSPDPYLNSTAEAWLNTRTDVTDSNVSQWKCRSRTVEDCMDQMIWIPEYRKGLLQASSKYVGFAAKVRPDDVQLRVLIASE